MRSTSARRFVRTMKRPHGSSGEALWKEDSQELWLCFASTPSRPRSVHHAGPGPIRRRDRKPIAERMLKNRQIILHTDGARSYKLSLPVVFHDNVMHKKKKMKVRGKTMWIKPHYTKVCAHKLPDGKVLKVKAGTQIVDRFWGHLRSYLKHTPRKVGSALLARKVRAAQWTYWHKGQDLWAATGTMLEELCT